MDSPSTGEVVATTCSVIEAANSKAYEKANVNYFLHASILTNFGRGAPDLEFAISNIRY